MGAAMVEKSGKEWRVTGKGGSPMLCTLSSFCSAEFPCREEEAEEGEEEACQEEEEEGEKEGGLSHAVHPQQLLQL